MTTYTTNCPICGRTTTTPALTEARWASPEVLHQLTRQHPRWQREDGACPACVQQALLQLLLEKGDAALHESIQSVWPLDVEAAFGALPTPLRIHADPRFTGKGVTIALIDSAFYPHPDLVQPHNRIRAWVDASRHPVQVKYFEKDERPYWPGWDAGRPEQWHGLMTAVAAAGNGWLSHGLYRGLASDAEVVLVQVRNRRGRITNASIERALNWLLSNGSALGVRVVNLSVAGDPIRPLAGNPVDRAVAALVEAGLIVVAAAGNDGRRRLIPPATAPEALTIGGLDDQNNFDHGDVKLWQSNYGLGSNNLPKPELVAPSIWVVAPILPDSQIAHETSYLFDQRSDRFSRISKFENHNDRVESRIAELKLVTPNYQHVEGTSFAAVLVASVVVCMLQANPALTPAQVRELLLAAARAVPGASRQKQGAGALDAGQAVALALRAPNGPLANWPLFPQITSDGIIFLLHDHHAESVHVLGSWDGWQAPGVRALKVRPGIWQARHQLLAPGRYAYKYLINRIHWLDDPSNPRKKPDGLGGFNSIIEINDRIELEPISIANPFNVIGDEQ
jgi:serine protease AprX